MNDIGYTNDTFCGSILETNIITASERYMLENLLKGCQGAVSYHNTEQNSRQVKFFQSGIDLINKRLKLKMHN